jgi:hypothetical protein
MRPLTRLWMNAESVCGIYRAENCSGVRVGRKIRELRAGCNDRSVVANRVQSLRDPLSGLRDHNDSTIALAERKSAVLKPS